MKQTNYSIDNKKVSYEILEDGYKIYLDGKEWIHQYEPYIPNRELSYEENAIAQIEEIVASYEEAQKEPSIDERIAMLEAELSELKAQTSNE